METTDNADIDFTAAQALMEAYPDAVYREDDDMVESVIIENECKLYLPAGKTVKLTPVTEEGDLGLLLVIGINYKDADVPLPFEELSGLLFEESDELDNKLDHGHVYDLPNKQVLVQLYGDSTGHDTIGPFNEGDCWLGTFKWSSY
jgi:hypothetical protein